MVIMFKKFITLFSLILLFQGCVQGEQTYQEKDRILMTSSFYDDATSSTTIVFENGLLGHSEKIVDNCPVPVNIVPSPIYRNMTFETEDGVVNEVLVPLFDLIDQDHQVIDSVVLSVDKNSIGNGPKFRFIKEFIVDNESELSYWYYIGSPFIFQERYMTEKEKTPWSDEKLQRWGGGSLYLPVGQHAVVSLHGIEESGFYVTKDHFLDGLIRRSIIEAELGDNDEIIRTIFDFPGRYIKG